MQVTPLSSNMPVTMEPGARHAFVFAIAPIDALPARLPPSNFDPLSGSERTKPFADRQMGDEGHWWSDAVVVETAQAASSSSQPPTYLRTEPAWAVDACRCFVLLLFGRFAFLIV